MKLRLLLTLAVLASRSLSAESAAEKEATVRKELETRYRELAAAHERQDLKAILGFRTPDFHSIFPDGKVGDSKQMEEYSRQFLAGNLPPYDIRVTIQKLTVSENRLIAVAEVFQEATRYRDLAGQRRRVDTSAKQRETWAKQNDGWRLKSVDNVRDQRRFVDGKRVDPTKPYDPDAPPFAPDSAEVKESPNR